MEHFNFKGFSPSEALRVKANRALDRIMERAPSDAKVTAVVEQENDMFHCSIEIGSSSCPFSLETSHKLAAIALDKAELAAIRKLERWSGARFIKMEDASLRAPLRAAT